MKKLEIPQISFEVTSNCNLKCRYCYNHWKSPEYGKFTEFNSYVQAKKTLKRIFKIANVKHVSFSGGEPFLAERFAELVLYVKMKGKSVTIISNGNVVNQEDLRLMTDLKVNLFELPIHSFNSEIHDYLTTINGSWQKSKQSIEHLLKLKNHVVAVIVITKANYKEIDKTLEFIHDLGLNRVMLNRFNIGGNGISEKENLELSRTELNEAFSKASLAGLKFKLSLSSNVCTPLCVTNPHDYQNIRFSKCSNDVSKRPLTLDILGDLRFCNHSPVVLGNIFKQSLNEIFNSEQALLWTNTIPHHCSTCQLFSQCNAGCRAASEQLNGSLDYPDPVIFTK